MTNEGIKDGLRRERRNEWRERTRHKRKKKSGIETGLTAKNIKIFLKGKTTCHPNMTSNEAGQ
jgi:hypothetical protein